MSAIVVAEEARRRGVDLYSEGGKLRWRSRRPLPAGLRGLLVAHKAELVHWLSTAGDVTGAPRNLLSPAGSVDANCVGRARTDTSAPTPPWDQAEADTLVAEAQVRYQQHVADGGGPEDSDTRRLWWPLLDRLDECWLARDLGGLRAAVQEINSVRRGPPCDSALADHLLADLRAEVQRIAATEFAGHPPEALRSVLADAVAIGQGYIDNHAAETSRGWDALELLRGLVPQVRRCAANARELFGTGEVNTCGSRSGPSDRQPELFDQS